LADREGLIQLEDHSTQVPGFLSAQPIPWLDCDQKLRLHQPDEVRLIHQLVKMVDDLVFSDSSRSVNWETAALKLSAAFDSFWCNCRIWGEVKINSWELAQARLGLLIATQLVLRSVLETKLGVFAPVEL
jgi:arginyl-tRNA synthetase